MVILHAVTLLIVGFSPLIVWRIGKSVRKGAPPSFIRNLAYAVPFLIIGGIFSSVLSTNGAPLSEWAIPTFVVLAAAFIAPTTSSIRVFAAVVFFICIGLCIEGITLRNSGYTSNPAMTASSSAARSKTILSSVRSKIEKQEMHLLNGPVLLKELVDQEVPTIESLHVTIEWHTPITGLFRIVPQQQEIWIMGLEGTVPRLEAKPIQTAQSKS